MVLFLRVVNPHLRAHFRLVEYIGEIQALRLPVINRLVHVQPVAATDHFIHGAEPQLRHQFPHLLGDKPEKVLHELRLAVEFLTQLFVLSRHTYRTGIQVADPHHDTAADDQGGRGETEFLGAQQGRDHHVAPGFQLAVGLHDDTIAQLVLHQHLLGFGQSQFPGQSRVFQ